MSAVNTTTFANKKPPVEGVDPVTQIGFPNIDGGGGTADTDQPEEVYASLSLTATKSINKGYLRRYTPFDYNNNGSTFRVREDDINGTILTSQNFPAGNTTSAFNPTLIITNQPVGARTYVYTKEQNSPAGGDFIRLHGGANTLAYIVDIDGSKNTNIIRG